MDQILAHDVVVIDVIQAAGDEGQNEPSAEAVFVSFQNEIECSDLAVLNKQIIYAACDQSENDIGGQAGRELGVGLARMWGMWRLA